MENLLKNHRHAVSRAARTGRKRARTQKSAQEHRKSGTPARSQKMNSAKGRLDHGPAIAVIDIGSNSVRLVVYEGLTRSPTPIFNEKVLAGLGREVQSTGLLAPEAVLEALQALKRFRALCDTLQVGRVLGIATAACRDARNGAAFIEEAERICRVKIDVLSGKREAELSALGVISGIYEPSGIVGDLGGGSLELVDIHGTRIRRGVTLPLGGLDAAGCLPQVDQEGRQARRSGAWRMCRSSLPAATARSMPLAAPGVRSRACTWRRPAIRCMSCTNTFSSAREAIEFCELVHRVNPETLSQIEVVANARRPLLGYAAVVLEHLVRRIKPADVVISALGVREGLLYSLLPRGRTANRTR